MSTYTAISELFTFSGKSAICTQHKDPFQIFANYAINGAASIEVTTNGKSMLWKIIEIQKLLKQCTFIILRSDTDNPETTEKDLFNVY